MGCVDVAVFSRSRCDLACFTLSLWLGEAIFRAGKEGVDQAVAAIRKVYENRAELAATGRGDYEIGE